MVQSEILSQEQAQEKKHQVRDSFAEIERRERRHQRGAKECHLNQMMGKLMLEQVEVVEAYSPPRIAAMARKMGLRVAWSLDLMICEEHGQPLDFKNMRGAAVMKLTRDKPILLIGRLVCKLFSPMSNLNYVKMTEENNQKHSYGRNAWSFASGCTKYNGAEDVIFCTTTPRLPALGKRSV